MRIDSHQHFWHYNDKEFSWIGENMSVLKRDFLPADLLKELHTAGFDGSIAVQARQTLEETAWLLDLAAQNSFIKGVVGWVDLCAPEIEKQLAEFSKNQKLVGVRHVIHDEPDDKFMARKDFQYGISLLAKYGLTYDLLIFPKHLPVAAELVRLFPKQKFVLDHIAKPLIKDQIHEPWDKYMQQLANSTNVYCKFSGMVTEADWKNWKADDFKYYLDTIFHCFGDDRLMMGSDWPVCTIAGNYKKVMSLVTDYLQQFGKETLSKTSGENCRKFYLEK